MIADNGSSQNELEMKNEPPYDKTNKMTCAPSENSHKPGIRPVWCQSDQSLRCALNG